MITMSHETQISALYHMKGECDSSILIPLPGSQIRVDSRMGIGGLSLISGEPSRGCSNGANRCFLVGARDFGLSGIRFSLVVWRRTNLSSLPSRIEVLRSLFIWRPASLFWKEGATRM